MPHFFFFYIYFTSVFVSPPWSIMYWACINAAVACAFQWVRELTWLASVQTPASVIALISSLPIKHTRWRSRKAYKGAASGVAFQWECDSEYSAKGWYSHTHSRRHNAFTAGTERGTLTSRLRLLMPSLSPSQKPLAETRKAPPRRFIVPN